MNKNMIPTTTRHAFKILDEMITIKEQMDYIKIPKYQFLIDSHFGLGMWIRNNWLNVPDADRDILDKCVRMLSGKQDDKFFIIDPDYISELFLGRYYDHLKRIFRSFEVSKELEEYVKTHGYEVSDLTLKELDEAAGELFMINSGFVIMDGVFSPQGSIWLRETEEMMNEVKSVLDTPENEKEE